MPALDTAQIQSLRTALAQRESALLKDLQGAQREQLGAKPLDGSHEVIDPTELAYRHEQQEIDDDEATREHGELRTVRAALARMDDGSYGECIDCGVDIPLARLQAQPAALRCVPCQEKVEQAAQRV